MSNLVTGEAVVLDLRLARWASRGVAMALDVLAQAVLMLVVQLLYVSGAGGVDRALRTAIGVVIAVAVLVGYPVLFETLTRGRSPGKMAMGLRVVRDDGGPIRFRHALVRGLTGFFVDFWVLGVVGAVAIVVSQISARAKRVGDILAGTVVISERMPADQSPPVTMPPELAGWASGLNVGAVPDGLALAVRQFLGRYRELEHGARTALGARLATEVGSHLGVPLPVDGWAPHYLAAVLAERRAREQRRTPLPAPPPAPMPPPAQHVQPPEHFPPPG
jgi:uncharacterized RDD family membrane protein YckC